MKTYKKMPFSHKIVLRNRILMLALILLLVYVFAIAELNIREIYPFIGDSRTMTNFAQFIGRIIFLGSFIFLIIKIRANRRLINDYWLRKDKMVQETDELNQQLYEKSGGLVLDIILIFQLFITETTTLMNMEAFNCAFATLVVILLAKVISYAIVRFGIYR